jgi:hypothetical protein
VTSESRHSPRKWLALKTGRPIVTTGLLIAFAVEAHDETWPSNLCTEIFIALRTWDISIFQTSHGLERNHFSGSPLVTFRYVFGSDIGDIESAGSVGPLWPRKSSADAGAVDTPPSGVMAIWLT